jgi:hypothetical protein
MADTVAVTLAARNRGHGWLYMKIYEVVSVWDVEPIFAGESEESFKFRIEVLRDPTRSRLFSARVFRRETIRARATFPLGRARGYLADHEVLVSDEAIGAESFQATSATAVLRKVCRRIEETFGT